MNYQVYEVEERDKDALAQLRIVAMKESLEAIVRFDPERARSRFIEGFQRSTTRKIVIEGRLVGFYVVRDKVDHLYLDHVYIHPEVQVNGLGGSILKAVILQAQQRRLPLRLCALLGSRSNEFYQSHGFVQTHKEEWDIYYEYRSC